MGKPSAGHFCWNELVTNDVNKAKDFYSKVLGWEFKELKSEDMIYTIVTSDTKDIAGIWQIPADQENKIPPHWMSYILVDNIKETLEKSKQHGALEVKGVTHVGDMGSFAIVQDPTGAHIAFWESKNR